MVHALEKREQWLCEHTLPFYSRHCDTHLIQPVLGYCHLSILLCVQLILLLTTPHGKHLPQRNTQPPGMVTQVASN